MSNTLVFLRQQNDDLFKENRELRNKLLSTEVRLGEKLYNEKVCCGNCGE